MNPNEQAAFLSQALAQAPAPIQAYLASDKYDAFRAKIHELGTFHVDVEGKISNEILMMLLGMSQPQELIANLVRETGITEEEASAVAVLANQEIFTPIQEEMRSSSTTQKTASDAPKDPLVTAPTLVTSSPVPAAPLPPVPEPYVPPQTPAVPTMRTMAHDVESIKDGSVAAPVTRTLPTQAPVPVAPTPLPAQWAAPVTAPTDAPSFTKVPAAPVSKTPAPSLQEVTSTLQKYGIDPYRELPE